MSELGCSDRAGGPVTPPPPPPAAAAAAAARALPGTLPLLCSFKEAEKVLELEMKEAAPTGEVIAQQWLGGRGGEGVEEGLLFATAGEGDPAGLVQVRGTLWLLLAMRACYGSGCHDHTMHSRQCPRMQQKCMAGPQEAHAVVALRHAALNNPCPARRPLTALRRGWTTRWIYTRSAAAPAAHWILCMPGCIASSPGWQVSVLIARLMASL